MVNLKNFLAFLTIAIFFTSCLKSGLDELPVYNQANITDFKFEYRYEEDGEVNFVRLDNDASIDTVDQVVKNIITLPNDFPQSEKNNVSLEKIVGIADISTAATIRPVDGSPKLGEIGDFSNNLSYKVTAANDENKKTWSITSELIK